MRLGVTNKLSQKKEKNTTYSSMVNYKDHLDEIAGGLCHLN